ncbi:MAG: hypothetical protein EHM88_03365 [Candidatus Rokuibacteriota bacterium]|nr:MAG: hypothetical protein EHM88_03365 [Candidatus Rokubacteria bacterium]
MATKDKFPFSEADVPLGHDERGNPLPPVPHDPPQFAEPGAITDHDELKAQSGTKDRLDEMDRPPGEHGKGPKAKFRAVTSLTAVDSPLSDKDRAAEGVEPTEAEGDKK